VAPAAASRRRYTPHRWAAAAGAVLASAGALVLTGGLPGIGDAAAAHGSDPSVRTILDTVEPPLPGVTVQVATSVTAQLVVANPTPTELAVLDGSAQPFLRIGPEGVLANLASPYWYLTNSPNGDAPVPPDAKAGAPARWARVAAEPAWGWFEHRLHPAPRAVPRRVRDARKTTTLDEWTVPLDYGGQPVTASGRIVYQPERGAVTARLRGPARPFRGVAVQVAPGRVPALFLTNTGPAPVVVVGRDGEPFARVGPDGVEVNRHSPMWADNARAQDQDVSVAASIVDPSAPPEWAVVTSAQSYSWLEFRGLYARDRPPRRIVDGHETAVLRTWTVPLERDGREVKVRGETVWKPVKQ
jgi:hypothetical protein